MLCGLLRPTSGTALVGGIDVGQRSGRRQAAHRLHVAALLALRAADRRSEHPLLRRRLRPRPAAARARREFVLEMAGLRGRETTLARDLSGGWRQRLALGCAILHEPPILFLDEPTGGVDPAVAPAVLAADRHLSQSGVTVLVTTHYLDEAERCHRVALIHAGRLAAIGTTSEVKSVFAGRPIVEVRADNPVRRCSARRHAGGREDQPVRHGRARRAATSRGSTPATLRAALARRRRRGRHRSPKSPPSLEDVFLDVVERAGGGDAREKALAVYRKELRQIAPRSPDADDPRVRPGVLPAALRLRAQLRHPPHQRWPSRIATARPRAARWSSAFVNSGYFDLVGGRRIRRPRPNACSI